MGSRLLMMLMLLVLLQAVWKGALGKSHSLHTRGIVELAGAISCGTGRSPLAYIGYGCYCGLGGQGWPKDKTDWCCHRHDCCYDKAEKEGCSPKAQRYQWACEQNAVRCASATEPTPAKAGSRGQVTQASRQVLNISREGDSTAPLGRLSQRSVTLMVKNDAFGHRSGLLTDKEQGKGSSTHNNSDNLTDRCEKMVCLCDQEAARCWGAAPYNPHFILWPDFLCGQTHPTCHFRYGGAE